VCNVQYVLPFLILLFAVEWEGEHSPDEEPVGCHFIFEWVIREEIDDSVGCGGFA